MKWNEMLQLICTGTLQSKYTMIQSTNFIVWMKWNLCQLNGKLSPMCFFSSSSSVLLSVSQSVSHGRYCHPQRNFYVKNAQIKNCTNNCELISFSFFLTCDLKSNAIMVCYMDYSHSIKLDRFGTLKLPAMKCIWTSLYTMHLHIHSGHWRVKSKQRKHFSITLLRLLLLWKRDNFYV